jgi:hypothetical protein
MRGPVSPAKSPPGLTLNETRNSDTARVLSGCCPRQGRQMVFKIETRHGIVGLRLQIGRFDPAHARGLQPRHPPAFQKIGHQRGDEHGLACPAQTGDAQPDHRGREEPCHTMRHIRDLVAKRLCDRLDDQLGHPFAVFLRE